jgi:uncharacterized membrane protein YkoI
VPGGGTGCAAWVSWRHAALVGGRKQQPEKETFVAQVRRIGFALAGALAMGFLLSGALQAAPAPRGKAHPASAHAKITVAQARAAALKRFPGKVVGKTPLENEEGTWQYGVMVQSGKTLREVMVNAKTGKIDSVEVTTASKEGAEAKAEAARAKPKAAPRRSAKPAKSAPSPAARAQRRPGRP